MREALQYEESYNLTEDQMISELEENLYKILVDAKEALDTQTFASGGGMETFIMNCLKQMKQEVSVLLVSQLFTLAESKEESQLPYPTRILAAFEGGLKTGVTELVSFHNSLNEQTKIDLAAQIEIAHKMFQEFTKTPKNDDDFSQLYTMVIQPLNKLNELRMNIDLFFFNEFMFQFLFAQQANESEFEMIQKRIVHLYGIVNRLILVTDSNITRELLDSRIEELYKLAFFGEQDSKRSSFYPKICSGIVHQIKHIYGTEESIFFAKRLLLVRVELESPASNFILKHTLDMSLYHNMDEKDPISLLKGFDLLIEFDHPYFEAYNNLFRDFWVFIPSVLENMNQNMYQNMVLSRKFLEKKIISDNVNFYNELYVNILYTVAKSPKEVVENFALALNREIDQLSSTKDVENLEFSEFYWAMKIHIANLAPNSGWKMTIRKLKQEDLEKNALFVEKFARLNQAVDKALSSLGEKDFEGKAVKDKLALFGSHESLDAAQLKIFSRALI